MDATRQSLLHRAVAKFSDGRLLKQRTGRWLQRQQVRSSVTSHCTSPSSIAKPRGRRMQRANLAQMPARLQTGWCCLDFGRASLGPGVRVVLGRLLVACTQRGVWGWSIRVRVHSRSCVCRWFARRGLQWHIQSDCGHTWLPAHSRALGPR